MEGRLDSVSVFIGFNGARLLPEPGRGCFGSAVSITESVVTDLEVGDVSEIGKGKSGALPPGDTGASIGALPADIGAKTRAADDNLLPGLESGFLDCAD